jgi:hypothetical protein
MTIWSYQLFTESYKVVVIDRHIDTKEQKGSISASIKKENLTVTLRGFSQWRTTDQHMFCYAVCTARHTCIYPDKDSDFHKSESWLFSCVSPFDVYINTLSRYNAFA